ncbi:RICIN domain-containing protein [Streptomyces sp. NPDC007205]|uniref:RICIN domain-containing protein n=1 Tax=Streptomyces sp. NPDC007205 TaxID=3154316 RepID=UPI0033E85C72
MTSPEDTGVAMSVKSKRSSSLITIIIAACLAAFGLALSPMAAGKAHAADCPSVVGGCVSFISGVDNSSVIDVPGGKTDSDALQRWSANGADNQHFQIYPLSNGTVEIKSKLNTSLCFGNGGNTTVGWTYIRLNTCTGSDDQKWYFEPDPGGGYLIRQVADDAVLPCLRRIGGIRRHSPVDQVQL